MLNKTLCALGCALLMLLALPACAQDVIRDQARCHTTWDDAYFYLSFKVDCPDVRGTHTKPNAEVTGDDCVEFYVETANKHPQQLNPTCFSMAVSAAGGAQFRAGTEAGSMEPTPVYSFKYGVTVQGTINNSDDIDQGYAIEMAVPWDVMKTSAPATGNMMSFNVVVRGHGGEFVSLSPRVKSEADVLSPANWVNLVFAAHSFGAVTASVDKIVSAKYVVRPPLIDGVIQDKEWHRNTSFALDLPMPPGFVYEAKFPVQRMVFAPYHYWYQGDTRRAPGGLPAPEADPMLTLTDFPIKGPGPWFSHDRVQWHKDELADIVAAGIDVVLPVYRGDAASRAANAARGLDCLVSAIAEMREEGRRYPLVGMFLDTSSMSDASGGKPDLAADQAKQTFYRMIREFFQRVPEEFRAQTQCDKPSAGESACILFLGASDAFSALDSSFVTYCNESFRRDFGQGLVWIASDDYKGKADGFDGFCRLGAGLGATFDDSGRIDVGAIGPGFDNSAAAPLGQARIRSREGGQTYDKDWEFILTKNPHWIVCDTWNAFADGSEISASRQYGRACIDSTSAHINRFLGGRDFSVRYIRWNVPRVIPPKQFAQAELVVRNAGNSPWRASDGYALTYRWYKTGRFFGESKIRRPLERDVMPGDTVTVVIGIAPVGTQGAQLPEGDYELRFELFRMSDNKWFSALGDQPLTVPITIGKTPEWGASYLSCDAPTMLATAQLYPCTVRVRNDGSELWRKGVTKLGCRLYTVSDGSSEAVPTRDIRALLPKDCKPGEIAEFDVPLNLAMPNGKPLPTRKPDDPSSYQLRFDIHNSKQWLSELGVRTLDRTVGIFETDYGARIVDSDLPRQMTAGQTYECKVVVRNNGKLVWDRKRTSLGYHWYHADGVEMLWEGETTPIPANIQPGWPAVVTAKVAAPEYDGQYVLVWDVKIDDTWLSTAPLVRGGDILPIQVEVTEGRLEFVDLASVCDISAASPDTNRGSGDFDGAGASFPAEFMPPDATFGEPTLLYPSGYLLSRAPQPEGRVSFRYLPHQPGEHTAVACALQKIDIEDGSYRALHILGASTDGAATGEIGLDYADAPASAAITMSDWTGAPASGEKIALVVRHVHTNGGDQADRACRLYHYTIPLDPAKRLTAVTLPKNEKMKIVALTLERAALPARRQTPEGG